MQDLEYKYLHYINQIQQRNFWAWIFRPMYKKRLKKRHTQLVSEFEKHGGDKEAFVIWNKLLLKHI